MVDEPEVLGNDLESVQVNTKWAEFVYNKDGFHIKDGFNDEVAKDRELSRTFEELLLDHGEGAKTPTYMDHQCETEMSMTSSDVRSWGSYSSGALVNGVGQWADEGPVSLVFAPLKLAPVWQISANAQLSLLADQVEQTPKYPELIANEDMMEP